MHSLMFFVVIAPYAIKDLPLASHICGELLLIVHHKSIEVDVTPKRRSLARHTRWAKDHTRWRSSLLQRLEAKLPSALASEMPHVWRLAAF